MKPACATDEYGEKADQMTLAQGGKVAHGHGDSRHQPQGRPQNSVTAGSAR